MKQHNNTNQEVMGWKILGIYLAIMLIVYLMGTII